VKGNTIQQVEHIKFLSVVIDENLKWQMHIKSVARKIYPLYQKMIQIRYIIPMVTRRLIYDALIVPIFTYGLHVWGNTYHVHSQKLSRLHKKLIKIMYFVPIHENITELCQRERLLTLAGSYKYYGAIFIFKELQKCENNRCFDLNINCKEYSYNIRNKDKLSRSIVNCNYRLKSIRES
jgi:hypothetical protein